MTLLERHQIALAREACALAGVPLRGRYGYAASDEHVLALWNIVAEEKDDERAVNGIGIANALGDIEIAREIDTPSDEEYEHKIVSALREVMMT